MPNYVDHKKESEMHIADALSRAFPPAIIPEQFEEDIASERFIQLMSSESYVTDRKLQAIKDDLFDWNGKPHLIVVDYYSRYPEVSEFRNTKARTVINKTKSIFSRHGIPESESLR